MLTLQRIALRLFFGRQKGQDAETEWPVKVSPHKVDSKLDNFYIFQKMSTVGEYIAIPSNIDSKRRCSQTVALKSNTQQIFLKFLFVVVKKTYLTFPHKK